MDNGSQKELRDSADIISRATISYSDCRRIGKEPTSIDVSAVNKENSAKEITNVPAPTKIFFALVSRMHTIRCSNKRHEVSRSTYLSNKGFASVFGLFFKLRLKLLILSS